MAMRVPTGGCRAAAISKMERFVIIVNGFSPLTIITKRSILDVAAALDPPLSPYEVILENSGKSTMTLTPYRSLYIEIYETLNNLSPRLMKYFFKLREISLLTAEASKMSLDIPRTNQLTYGAKIQCYCSYQLPVFVFKKDLFEVKTSGLQLSFNIFR